MHPLAHSKGLAVTLCFAFAQATVFLQRMFFPYIHGPAPVTLPSLILLSKRNPLIFHIQLVFKTQSPNEPVKNVMWIPQDYPRGY